MYRSVIAIYERRYRDAVHYVHASRRHMPIVSEGGNVTHSQLTHAQVLCSLEEIITLVPHRLTAFHPHRILTHATRQVHPKHQ